ncbi:GNAT family N-acetyltransferase [Bacillus paralicheniformis]|uniref:GNAT family N-acetyltransferase n=1 Tax=Bacillus TaxID=1386 RepID=UPI0009514774|nr:GNAT family N-acetyltransferase [Bacillus paralicheniformis]MSN98586.1 GNAT family N-acetyltransferase [Bacillus paralicheniformis]MSO02594.1 GNAT family N-acetyltransferase [Bacillus paralicheniformis]MSO06587.1 GNAT family N-acetyltransferase [Bacillus paralicheniformis]MSO10581.1 GNAT family N-acetyltransferase [Bacillus paralicheniformis]NJE36335.1 GNAT family N-acetyltransferase [Bacillus paralicheniformis]
MSNIEELRLFRKEDIEWLQTWFDDAEVKRRLEGMMPLDEWFNFADGNENYRVWAALKEGKPVGAVMVEVEEDSTGNIALLVDPLLRGGGYGKALIKRTMALPEMNRINKWFAGIEEDNKRCLACFRSVGYSLEHDQPDEDGYYSLIYFPES